VKRQQAPMTGAMLDNVVRSVNRVLEVLHDKGLVHREINPANIMMLENGNVVLIDWSFCCRQGVPQVATSTAGYTAPEQKKGKAVCESDWYSLSATCFALANGYTLDDVPPRAVAEGIRQIQLDHDEFLGWPVPEYFERLLFPKP